MAQVVEPDVPDLTDGRELEVALRAAPRVGVRRRLLVAITPPAQDLVRQYVPEVVALQGAVMNGISEEDRQQLIAVLTRIREAIAAVP